ncbi:hypothetical protein [Clostridium sp. HV4-5-A1G]|uniref:hypothetical protein n=1 Tax=Clostridium sp. HV4-5-A1G TaxID=2004595 RepID=UPI00123A0447|nr:hypothetical protein [Clostridium sp. HV4-5-A1G]KAA8674431.1 hypothetical protein F3O63_07880 [Clostridium sp. HV4-5-A1G]
MDSTKKKMILLASATIAIVFISCALIYEINSRHFNTSNEYLKQGHSLSEKKRFDENMEYANKYNARIKNMDKLDIPSKGSAAPDIQKVSEAEKSNSTVSLYFLFNKKLLNTDQYINAEDKLNAGIKEIADIENSRNLNEYFNANKDNLKNAYGISSYNELACLKSKFQKLDGSRVSVIVDQNFTKTEDGRISFNVILKGSGNAVSQNVMLRYASDVEMDISWKL